MYAKVCKNMHDQLDYAKGQNSMHNNEKRPEGCQYRQ